MKKSLTTAAMGALILGLAAGCADNSPSDLRWTPRHVGMLLSTWIRARARPLTTAPKPRCKTWVAHPIR